MLPTLLNNKIFPTAPLKVARQWHFFVWVFIRQQISPPFISLLTVIRHFFGDTCMTLFFLLYIYLCHQILIHYIYVSPFHSLSIRLAAGFKNRNLSEDVEVHGSEFSDVFLPHNFDWRMITKKKCSFRRARSLQYSCQPTKMASSKCWREITHF